MVFRPPFRSVADNRGDNVQLEGKSSDEDGAEEDRVLPEDRAKHNLSILVVYAVDTAVERILGGIKAVGTGFRTCK